MQDLISRQAAINELNAKYHGMISDESMKIYQIINWLDNLPSAQPEIIRCKDCKYASGNSRICLKLGHSPIGELDFCSYAERIEETE